MPPTIRTTRINIPIFSYPFSLSVLAPLGLCLVRVVVLELRHGRATRRGSVYIGRVGPGLAHWRPLPTFSVARSGRSREAGSAGRFLIILGRRLCSSGILIPFGIAGLGRLLLHDG